MNSNQPPAPAADADADDAVDALLEELVAQALELFRDRIAPEHLPDFEAALYEFYETNPAAVQLVEQLCARPSVARSGAVAKSADDELAEVFLRAGQKGGGGR